MAETSEASTTEVTETNDPETQSDSDLGGGGKAALEAERRARRAADRELKAAKAELDGIKAATMSETEKAVKAARDEGIAEGLRVGASKIAQAEIRAAATGRSVDVDALLEGIDAGRFVGDDGEVDRTAVVSWIDKVAPAPEPTPEPTQTIPPLFPDLGQGPRGSAPALNSTRLEKDLKAALHID